MKKYLLLLFGLLFYVTLPAQQVKDSKLKLAFTNPLNPNLIKVTHIAGNSNGSVNVSVINSTQLTGDNYLVFFNVDNELLCWNLKNITKNIIVASNQLVKDPIIVDGLYIEVTSLPEDITRILVTSNANGILNPPDIGCFAFNASGFPTSDGLPANGVNDRPSSRQQINGAMWGIHTGVSAISNDYSFSTFKMRVTQGGARWPLIIPNDFEIRFTNSGGKAIIYPSTSFGGVGGSMINVPFELWNVGTKSDASDDVRYFPYILDNNDNGKFDLSKIDHTISGGDNDPETDWFYWVIPKDQSPGQAGYNAIVSEGNAHVGYNSTTTAEIDSWRRMVLVGLNLGSVSATDWPDNIPLNKQMPETGTTFKIITSKPNTPGSDLFLIRSMQTCTDINLSLGWNLISVPIQTNSMYTQNIFPDFVSQTYGFSNGLRAEDNLTLGKGYWLKYSANKTISLCGQSSGVITVPVNEGWNLIGGYNWNVNISNVTSSPSSILTTPFYGYDNGYSVASQLEIGKGYWVKSSANGIINLNVGLLKSNDSSSRILVDDSWDKIILSNSNNEIITLFNNSGSSSGNLSFELPPLPPKEIFDCRYSSNLLVENLSSGWKTIDIQSKSYPIKLRTNGISLEVRESEREKSKIITKNQEFIVSNPAVKNLQIRTFELPSDYSLGQNYPNPFNPETVIKYQIPAISHVTLKVYDVLGRELVKLIDEIQQPGNYQSTFNTHDLSLSSGVYFYRLQAGEFIQTKKMILTK